MATTKIPVNLSVVIWSGATTKVADLAFLPNLRVITTFSANGSGYRSHVIGNTLSSVTELVAGTAYILSTKTEFTVDTTLISNVYSPLLTTTPTPELPTDPVPTPTSILPFAASTSAGVFDKNTNHLVRTLWSGIAKPAGELVVTWDGKDDAGNIVTTDPNLLEYRVAYQDSTLKPVWEGVVGNTSDSFTANVWRSICVMQDFCVATNNESYAALGYNEGLPAIVRNPATSFQAPRRIKSHSALDCYAFVRVDDTYLYAVSNNSGWDNKQSSCVVRHRRTDYQIVPWTNGVNMTSGSSDPAGIPPQVYTGAVAPRQSATAGGFSEQRSRWLANRITGLAVNAMYIAVARKAQNSVELYNTTSGALLGTLTTPSPGQVSFGVNGDLWVITAGQVKSFVVTNGSAFTEKVTLPNVTLALAIDAHPTQDVILVADGSTSQQVKAYNATGTSLWTYGQAGGYPILGPTITNDTFWFEIQDFLSGGATDRDQFGDPFTFVKWQPDGTFWILDTANMRSLHLAADRSYLGNIMYLPDRLLLAGVQNDATRVFSGNLEFKVTLDPLTPGDQSKLANPSWKLVKNWGAKFDTKKYGILQNVTTHSNGRTYAQVNDNSTPNTPSMWVVELPSTGSIRLTPTQVNNYGNGRFSLDQHIDGTLRGVAFDYSVNDFFAEERAVTGYDSNFNPIYSAKSTSPWRVRTTFSNGTDPYPNKPALGQMRIFKASDGTYVTYKPNKTANPSFHLGIIQPTGTTWSAKFYPEKNAADANPQGTYTPENAYGGLDGGNFFVNGLDVVALYNGQNNGSSNTFDYFRYGLFINRFGLQNRFAGLTEDNAPAGFAGNCTDMYMARASTDVLHVYTVDEAVHAGLHRWRVPTKSDLLIIPVVQAAPGDTRTVLDGPTGEPNITYEGPLMVLSSMAGSDGVIRINKRHFKSTTTTPAVTLNCGSTPVIMTNCVISHKGRGISGGGGTNFTGTDISLYGNNPTMDGNARDHAIYMYRPTKVAIDHVTYESAGGVKIDGHDSVTMIKCHITNVKSRNVIGKNGDFRHCVQLANVHCADMVLDYVESFNEPDKSRTEDTINFYNSGGTDVNHKLTGKGFYLHGAYPYGALDTNFTGAQLSADGSGQATETPSRFIALQDAWLISACNAAANIATGNDISYKNLYIVTTGYLRDGRQLKSTYKGVWIGDYYNLGPGANNSISGITIRFIRTKDVVRRADFIADINYDPNPHPGIDVANAILLPDVSSVADNIAQEDAAFPKWVKYLNDNKQTVGSRYNG